MAFKLHYHWPWAAGHTADSPDVIAALNTVCFEMLQLDPDSTDYPTYMSQAASANVTHVGLKMSPFYSPKVVRAGTRGSDYRTEISKIGTQIAKWVATYPVIDIMMIDLEHWDTAHDDVNDIRHNCEELYDMIKAAWPTCELVYYGYQAYSINQGGNDNFKKNNWLPPVLRTKYASPALYMVNDMGMLRQAWKHCLDNCDPTLRIAPWIGINTSMTRVLGSLVFSQDELFSDDTHSPTVTGDTYCDPWDMFQLGFELNHQAIVNEINAGSQRYIDARRMDFGILYPAPLTTSNWGAMFEAYYNGAIFNTDWRVGA